MKTKSLESLEKKMSEMDEHSVRYQILQHVKDFKTSWIQLGQALYSVWKDKLYKEWGYNNFDTYTIKEVGIKKVTAMKLLRSYYFLEKEEPGYLKQEYIEQAEANQVPSYESVDALRLAKNKKVLSEVDYNRVKEGVFEKGKDVQEVRKEVTALIRQREELDPEEAHQVRRTATLKRFITALKSLRQDIESQKLLPMPIIKETEALIKKIEEQL